MSTNSLQVSEKFLSIQGEGWTTGVPAYFIRLPGCNLSCGFSKKGLQGLAKRISTLSKDEYREGGYDQEYADLYQQGEASWVCDSASVWLRGKKTTFEEIVEDWKKQNIYDWIWSQRVHIIWTGGEPTMLAHQTKIIEFMKYIDEQHSFKPFYEIETNGTIPITSELLKQLDQINCSAKLKNSGMSEEQRINPEAIDSIMSHDNYWFKFVVSTEEDIKEIIKDYIKPFNIPGSRVIMMPGLDRQDHYFERTNFVLEMAIKYGFIGLSRMHVAGWNQLTGK